MKGNGSMTSSKKADWGTIIFCVVGAAEWLFLSTAPSDTAIMIASLLLFFVFLAYCLLAVLLPGQSTPQRGESFVPLQPSDTYGPKALPF